MFELWIYLCLFKEEDESKLGMNLGRRRRMIVWELWRFKYFVEKDDLKKKV